LPHTLAEKILLAHSVADEVHPGDVVMVRCDVVMANDVSGPVAFRQMEKMGATRVFDPSKVVMVADHFMPAKDARSAELQRRLKEWSDEQGVTFYGQGRGGIEHTLLCEEGWIVPGSVIAEIGVGGGTNTVLEFTGDGAASLSVDERLAVANMAVEAGAETGFFPADDKAAEYLEGRTDRSWAPERSDPDAEFARSLRIDLDELSPLVALPHLPGNVVPVADVIGMKIDQVYIGNCSNGTMTDLRQTAEILRGHTVHRDCRMIVVPATQRIYREAMKEGLLDLFVEAGAMVSTPTCGACFGGGMGVLAAGERAVTTTNRNFKGRMGSPEAEVCLANAYVAAAAAVAGEIVDPADVVSGVYA